MQHALGPGLAKTRSPRLVARVERTFYRVNLHALETLLASADVVSEGLVVDGHWCGSTSIDLTLEERLSSEQQRALRACPHLRLKLLRVAQREAAARAPGAIESVRAELELRFEERLVRMVVDVEAALGHAPKRAADDPTTR